MGNTECESSRRQDYADSPSTQHLQVCLLLLKPSTSLPSRRRAIKHVSLNKSSSSSLPSKSNPLEKSLPGRHLHPQVLVTVVVNITSSKLSDRHHTNDRRRRRRRSSVVVVVVVVRRCRRRRSSSSSSSSSSSASLSSSFVVVVVVVRRRR